MTDPFGEQRRGVFHFDELLMRLSKIKSRIDEERAAKERIDEVYLQNDRSSTLEKLGVSGTSLGSASMAAAKLPRSQAYPEMELPEDYDDLNPDDDEPDPEPLNNSTSTESSASPEKSLAASATDTGSESAANHVTSGASASAEASAYSPKVNSKPAQSNLTSSTASASPAVDADGGASGVRRSERLKKSTKTAKV